MARFVIGSSLKMYFGHRRTLEWTRAVARIVADHPATLATINTRAPERHRPRAAPVNTTNVDPQPAITASVGLRLGDRRGDRGRAARSTTRRHSR